MKFVKVMKEEELPIGKSAIIAAGDKQIALFNYKGKYYAITNTCPHRGSPLGEGRIEEGIVICPNHEWRFRLKDGANMQNPELFIPTYPVKTKMRIYILVWKRRMEILHMGKRNQTCHLALSSAYLPYRNLVTLTKNSTNF